MHRLASFVASALLAGMVAGCGSSQSPAALRYGGPSPPPALGSQKPASAQEIEQAMSGNTLLAVTRSGNRWARYSKPNGYFAGYTFLDPPPATDRQWFFGRGQWRTEAGRLCVRPEEARQEACVRVVTGPGGVLHAYNEQDGNWQFSAEVRPGNPFEL